MNRISRYGAGLLVLGLVMTGCGGEDENAAASRPVISVFDDEAQGDKSRASRALADEAQDPVVERIGFEPKDPVAREEFRALADVSGTWTTLRYRWSLNGEPFGKNSAEVMLPNVATGDEILVRVIPYRGTQQGEPLEASRIVRNQKPQLRSLSIQRADPDEVEDELGEVDGEMWQAVVVAEDPDDERVEVEYRWFVNDRESEVDEAFFPASSLKQGDRLEVEVRAYDGRSWSMATRSGEIEVGNMPPEIVSTPPRPDESGFFRYRILVQDPDGLGGHRYSLRQAPRGMQIDEINGIVTWRPHTDQAGRHPVEVVVTDEGGAEASQEFSLALTAFSDAGADNPGPAAAR